MGLLKCFVQSTVIEGLMGFDDQCCVYYWLSQIFNQGAWERALLPAYPTSSTAYLFTNTQEWVMCIWLKLDQMLSLQVSAHTSFAQANFSSLALGLKLLPGHACCHTALCRGTRWLSLLSLPHTCTPTVCAAPLQGTCSLKGLENKVHMYWDECSEWGSNTWSTLAVEFLPGFLGRNDLTPHYRSGFRISEQ